MNGHPDNRYQHLKYNYLKDPVECNSGKKLVVILIFKRIFTNQIRKVMSTSKSAMKTQYDT